MHNKTIFAGIGIALFIIAVLLGFYGPDLWREARSARAQADFVAPGVPKSTVEQFGRQFSRLDATTEPKLLPDTDLLTITDKTVRFKDFGGKPTLVNLWARWCAPCVVELPSLQKLQEHYKGRMNVISVAVEQGVPAKDIAAFLEKRELGDFAGYIDQSGKMAQSLELRGIPTSFLIGSDGLILYRFEGDADWASADSKAFFDIFLLQKR